MAPHAVQRASGEVVPERGGGGRSNSHRRVTHAPCRRRRRRFHRWRCGWRSVGQPGERRVWSGDPVGLAPRNGLIVAASITVAVVSVGRSKLVNPLVIPNDWEPWQRRQQRLKRVHVSVAPTVVGHTQVIAVISHVDHDIYQPRRNVIPKVSHAVVPRVPHVAVCDGAMEASTATGTYGELVVRAPPPAPHIAHHGHTHHTPHTPHIAHRGSSQYPTPGPPISTCQRYRPMGSGMEQSNREWWQLG